MRLLLMHPWAGLPSRQALYIGLERATAWDLLIVTARRWKDDYGQTIDAAPDLRGRLLILLLTAYEGIQIAPTQQYLAR